MKQTILTFALVLASLTAYAAPVEFTAPEAWKKQKPTSRMRKFEYKVPRVEGDAVDAQVVVYFFGAMGGGDIESNIQRWRGQVLAQPGDPEPKRSVKTVKGLRVTTFDQVGTYTPPNFGRGPARPAQANTRIVNVVIETTEGNYFVKLMGPRKTVSANLKALDSFVSSVKGGTPVKPTSKPVH